MGCYISHTKSYDNCDRLNVRVKKLNGKKTEMSILRRVVLDDDSFTLKEERLSGNFPELCRIWIYPLNA
jgi:hypothetical protein